MTLIQLLFFCGLLALGSSWNQPKEVNSCYVRKTGTSNVDIQLNLLRDNILLIQENLENRIQATQCGGNSEQLQQLTERIFALEEGLRNINASLQELAAQNQGASTTQSTPITDPAPDVTTSSTATEPPTTTEPPPPEGTFGDPASSCSDIAQNSPSGEYWIQNTNSPVQVYCDMTRTCCNNTIGGWTRVANLDMTDPSQQCPDGFRLVTGTIAPLRTCGRPGPAGCVSTTFPVHGIEYSHVCGRVIGYQYSSTDGLDGYFLNRGLTIDQAYVDGVSLTHGQSPRQHIWTLVAASDEEYGSTRSCPCTPPDRTYIGVVPPFIDQDYFCETGGTDDPLWDGQGCGGTSTCCSFNNPPWFCKQLPQPTTDDIELRLCADQATYDEDAPLEIVEMYIK